VAARRFAVVLLALFSAIAVVLAAMGIYGIAYTVAHGTREFAVRMLVGLTRIPLVISVVACVSMPAIASAQDTPLVVTPTGTFVIYGGAAMRILERMPT
jgi:hypothetical protein